MLFAELGKPIARGGEGTIYEMASDPALAAKVFHQPDHAREGKILAMIADPPIDPRVGHPSLAWPIGKLTGRDSRLVGYVMRRVTGARPAVDLYNPATRKRLLPGFTYRHRVRAARNLASAFAAVHHKGHVIGDTSPLNVLVYANACVTLVDTDSFQVRNGSIVHPCNVLTPEFAAPELRGGGTLGFGPRGPEQDAFGLAILIFLFLMEGVHPFAGSYTGHEEPPDLDATVAAGHWPYGSNAGPFEPSPLALPFESLHPEVRILFHRTFDSGHRSPRARPTARDWQRALIEIEQSLIHCRAAPSHLYGGHVSSCPWCERIAALRKHAFPSRRSADSKLSSAPVRGGQSIPASGSARPGSARACGTTTRLWTLAAAAILLVVIGGLAAMGYGTTARNHTTDATVHGEETTPSALEHLPVDADRKHAADGDTNRRHQVTGDPGDGFRIRETDPESFLQALRDTVASPVTDSTAP